MANSLGYQFDRVYAAPIETYRQVLTIEARDLIPMGKRWEGMLCYVKSPISKEYKLIGGIDNINWVDVANLSALQEFTVKGTNFGRFEDGDLVPAHTTVQERFEDAYIKTISANWFIPTLNLTSSPTTSNAREIGETLNLTLSSVFTQNDGGTLIATVYKKNNVDLASNLDTIQLTETDISYQASTSYNEGTGTKPNNLGIQEPNPLLADTVNSNTLSFRGYKALFYGETPTKYTVSADMRTNLTKRLVNVGNNFILNSGITNITFQLWLPISTNLVSIIDLDALNADLTTSYISEALQVEDAAGNLINGTLYTMTQAVPYTENHRHQIIIS